MANDQEKQKLELELAIKDGFSTARAPLPVDPIARQAQQHAFVEASEALRVALDRGKHRIPILDADADAPPYWIISRGPAFIDDWKSAIRIRKELEQLTRELASSS